MAPVIQGQDAMTLVGTFRRHSRERGTSKVEEYRGPRAKAQTFYENAVADINNFNATYDDAEWDDRAGFGIVRLLTNEADDPNNEDDNAIWELHHEEEFVPLAQDPYWADHGNNIELDIRNCDQAIERGELYVSENAAAANKTKMGQYYGLRLAGVEGAIRSMPVIRKSVVLSNRSVIEAATGGIDAVVKDGAGNPIPPTGVPAKLGSDLDLYEWLKRSPRLMTRDGGKRFEIQYEWAGELKGTNKGWSTALYGGGWNPTA